MKALTAPGPSPWYLRVPEAQVATAAGACRWQSYDDAQLSGLSGLILPDGDAILLLNFYCYVQPLANDALLIWYEASGEIVFTLLDLSRLQVIERPRETATQVKARKAHLYFSGGNPAVFEFVAAVAEGSYSIVPPHRFQDIPEVLALADFEGAMNHAARRAIFAFDFKSSRVQVIPQEWFNTGNIDFGYQWITRVQRDPKTGRIFGDGIRLDAFCLDESGKRLGPWPT